MAARVLSEVDLHGYQNDGATFICDKPKCGLFALMGAGKTIITLTALVRMLSEFMTGKTLVVTTLRVASTVWPKEPADWEHTRGLRVSAVVGTEEERLAALSADADIYVTNYENIAWLTERTLGIAVRAPAKPREPKQRKGEPESSFNARLAAHRDALAGWEWQHNKDNPARWRRGKRIGPANFPWDRVVFDESRKVHDHSGETFFCAKRLAQKARAVNILTGTPSPQGLADLWAQIFLLDNGARLGHTITAFRNRWFDYNEYKRKYTPKKHAMREITELISDLVMVVESYEGLPRGHRNIIQCPLTDKQWAAYKEFEEERILQLPDGEVSPANAAVLGGKLLQFSSGAVYDDDRKVHVLHDAKLDALEELVESLNGDPLLVAYWYEHDLDRLRKRFPGAPSLRKDECKDTNKVIDEWNAGKIPLLFIHPQSGGHGLNMQFGGANLCWFTLTWRLELYRQLNARLLRQGQLRTVILHHLVVPGSIDERIIATLDGNADEEGRMLAMVREFVAERRKST